MKDFMNSQVPVGTEWIRKADAQELVDIWRKYAGLRPRTGRTAMVGQCAAELAEVIARNVQPSPELEAANRQVAAAEKVINLASELFVQGYHAEFTNALMSYDRKYGRKSEARPVQPSPTAPKEGYCDNHYDCPVGGEPEPVLHEEAADCWHWKAKQQAPARPVPQPATKPDIYTDLLKKHNENSSRVLRKGEVDVRLIFRFKGAFYAGDVGRDPRV